MTGIAKNVCPCCGYKTFDFNIVPGNFAICPVCFWENDAVQLADPDYSGGANAVSLREAQKNFKRLGACEMRFIEYVREAKTGEARSEDWKFIE